MTKEWGVPTRAEFKINSYVMLLSNRYDEDRRIIHSNGDCATIVDTEGSNVIVKLLRTGEEVEVERITRYCTQADEPNSKFPLPDNYEAKKDPLSKRWRVGEISYFPLRLAYASTVHKTQSLTLDKVQLDIRKAFMEQPAMCYTALSRCRSLAGLRIVGSPELLAKRCRIDERVLRFL